MLNISGLEGATSPIAAHLLTTSAFITWRILNSFELFRHFINLHPITGLPFKAPNFYFITLRIPKCK